MKHIKKFNENRNILRDFDKSVIICDTSCKDIVDRYVIGKNIEVFGADVNSSLISKLHSMLSIGYKNITVVVDSRKGNEKSVSERIDFIKEFVKNGRYDIKKSSDL